MRQVSLDRVTRRLDTTLRYTTFPLTMTQFVIYKVTRCLTGKRCWERHTFASRETAMSCGGFTRQGGFTRRGIHAANPLDNPLFFSLPKRTLPAQEDEE